jgi:GNAT superfamily N-acetyltransferase
MTFYLRTGIRVAGPIDTPIVAELLTVAFLHGDLAPWLVAHLDTRYRIYRPYFAMLAAHALDYGHVEITDEHSAVAIWYPISPPPIAHYDRRLADITGAYVHRFRALDHAMQRHHPHDRSHHYLAFLAVYPDQQNLGLGTALLTHHHTRLDATGTPAYLEATGTRNRRLYARHGYQPRPAYTIADGPVLYPMWRQPAASDLEADNHTEPAP